MEAKKTFANTASVLYDAVFVPGGAQSIATLKGQGDPSLFIDEAFKHGKPIAASPGRASALWKARRRAAYSLAGWGRRGWPNRASSSNNPSGALPDLMTHFLTALAHHRFFNRKQAEYISA